MKTTYSLYTKLLSSLLLMFVAGMNGAWGQVDYTKWYNTISSTEGDENYVPAGTYFAVIQLSQGDATFENDDPKLYISDATNFHTTTSTTEAVVRIQKLGDGTMRIKRASVEHTFSYHITDGYFYKKYGYDANGNIWEWGSDKYFRRGTYNVEYDVAQLYYDTDKYPDITEENLEQQLGNFWYGGNLDENGNTSNWREYPNEWNPLPEGEDTTYCVLEWKSAYATRYCQVSLQDNLLSFMTDGVIEENSFKYSTASETVETGYDGTKPYYLVYNWNAYTDGTAGYRVTQQTDYSDGTTDLRLRARIKFVEMTFEHYQGVLSTMGELPTDLQMKGITTADNENYYKTSTDDSRLNDDVKLQYTHEYERTVYAMPGQSIKLKPFSDINHTGNYYEKYTRWYDYTTDKNTDNLSFEEVETNDLLMVDQNGGVLNTGYGYFGGSILTGNRVIGTEATFTAPEEITGDYYIAMDLSCRTTEDILYIDENKLREPTLQYRHIFTIKDAREWAKSLSESVESNKSYVKPQKYAAPAGTRFQIRLPFQEPRRPLYETYYDESVKRRRYKKLGERPSEYWYITGEGRDGETYTYGQVYRYKVETYRKDAITGNVETFLGSSVVRQAFIDGNGDMGYWGTQNLFTLPDGTTIDNRLPEGIAYTEKTTTDNNYFRAINIDNPQAGDYIIRIYGLNSDGGDIYIYNTSEKLLLEEYYVTFQSEDKTSVLKESELAEKEIHTSAFLAKKYEKLGDITFDEYAAYITEADYLGERYYKWPVKWETSTYGFGFGEGLDYNIYRIAQHTDAVPFRGAADQYNNPESTYTDRITDSRQATTGLYDRLFYDTNGSEMGCFYYVNAASDPGRMAELSIVDWELCRGTRMHVSAWMAELSTSAETANLLFSFKAVKRGADGRIEKEATLNNYVTGYVQGSDRNVDVDYEYSATKLGERGQWLHVYFSFIPEPVDFEPDGYILSVENNCVSSDGADYAIDNIEVFASRPEVYAEQLKPVCNGDKTTSVEISVDFVQLLASIGQEETLVAPEGDEHDQHSFYYCFLNKQKFDEKYDESKSNLAEAFDYALVEYNYDGDETTNKYGMITFCTYYEDNEGTDVTANVTTETKNGQRMLVFNTTPQDNDLQPYNEYYILIYAPEGELGEGETPSWDITSPCAIKTTFVVEPSGIIKVNGEIQTDEDNIVCCANQLPVISLDMQGFEIKDDNRTRAVVDYSSYYDCYVGSYTDFTTAEKGEISAYAALLAFRKEYPTASELQEAKDGFTSDMHTLLAGLVANETLLLYRERIIWSDLAFSEGETEKKIYLTVAPINPNVAGYEYCLDPKQITLIINGTSPVMQNGFAGSDYYPEDLDMIPMRIGLEQLKGISDMEETANTESKYQWTENGARLVMPLRTVQGSTDTVTELQKSEDDFIYLADTDDKEFLNNENAMDNTEGDGGLLIIGRVAEITAKKTPGEGEINLVKLHFKNGFAFKEGHSYTLKIKYTESTEEMVNACDGEMLLPIKIVPEFMQWTGSDKNRNWNNDGNWRRVTSGELHRTQSDTDEYVTDGSNTTATAFTPLDFTKVIIPSGTKLP